MTRDQKLWAIALWLERTHGDESPAHIAQEVARLAKAGDLPGVAMWRQVAERYNQLRQTTSIN
ncbi:DUF6961 family protein [Tsuneonella aeria]|uniref:DUF6961 family protein n=1 Tax=Tsuneonella aeria TaxID=1837929 RepID=UPI003B21CE04